jgi:hypothetical protein
MPRGVGIILYGQSGVGKTSFALQFSKPLKCITLKPEAGYVDLDDIGKVPEGCVNIDAESYQEVKICLSRATEKTLVIDSLHGLQNSIFQYSIEKDYEGDAEEFYSYFKGPRTQAPKYAEELCTVFENLRTQGKNVILIAHSTQEKVKNPRGVDYDTIDLDADKGIRDVFKRWAQSILYLCVDSNVERYTKFIGNKNQKKPIEAKMKDEDYRMIFTGQSLVHAAKNKLNLPPYISAGDSEEETYANFLAALPQNFKEMLSK